MKDAYQICSRCVMDTSAVEIVFDDDGVCNFCSEFLERSGDVLHKDPEQRRSDLERLVRKVKAGGRRATYDCVVGVSGGVDSSWVLVQAVKLGLRPLAVHMDNGWNSELAQNNIANLVRTLGVDLYTHVIDWDEYRRLMQAFFDSDVIDVELLYDNAMLALNYQRAAHFGIKSILAGTNQATEGMRMPKGWNQLKFDKKNIKAIGKKFGNVALKSFPAIGTYEFIWYEYVRGLKWIHFLDNLEYNKAEAMSSLQSDYGYKPYPYKHYESIFTRFYQGYILPNKFSVDKRRVHLSTLIASGQMTRAEALEGLEGIPYPSAAELEQDIEYFLKKMKWTKRQLEDYMARSGQPHSNYPSEEGRWKSLGQLYKRFF